VKSASEDTVFTSFQFRVRDVAGDESDPATAQIVVIDIDDPPSSENIAVDTDENQLVKVRHLIA
jgi:hypothetical protein